MSVDLKIQTNTATPGKVSAEQAGAPIATAALQQLLGRASGAQQALPPAMALDLAALTGAPPADNPLNLQRVNNSMEISRPIAYQLSTVRLEVAGYSSAKLSKSSGYQYDEVARGLAAKGSGGKLGLTISPTQDPGSIDAAITGAALAAELPLLSVTAEPYTKYINADGLDAGIRERFLAQPKFVLPDGDAYVKANAELTNSWLALGGGDVAAKAFRHHVELDHPIVLADDGQGPRYSVEALRSENASAWLAEKLKRHQSGEGLHTVSTAAGPVSYAPAAAVELAKEAAAAAKKGGTTVASELAKRSPLPAEVFADAMMFEKAGLSEAWFQANASAPGDVRVTVLKVSPRLSPERLGAMAMEILQRDLSLPRS
ncbi:MAG: hypothetical protein U1E65_15625 [Myxococcota bacterium]